MLFRLTRNVSPREQEGIRKLLGSCGANRGISFVGAPNVVEVHLPPPDDHAEGPAMGRMGVCIENTLEQMGLLQFCLTQALSVVLGRGHGFTCNDASGDSRRVLFVGRPRASAAWRNALRPAARAWSMYAANPSTVTAWPLSRKPLRAVL